MNRPSRIGERLAWEASPWHPRRILRLILNVFHLIRAGFRSRSELAIESLALRQQLAVLKAKGLRPRLTLLDRIFWISLRRLWSKWPKLADALVIVKRHTGDHAPCRVVLGMPVPVGIAGIF